MLETGNMTLYPNACSQATASFSVLSETIQTIRGILPAEYEKLLDKLQAQEKKKLQLTAAHHLERIRQQTEQDERVQHLLSEGVNRLQGEIHECVGEINEVLEEIQCILLEAQEE